MSDEKDLATEGLEDELKGTAKKVEGRVGGATGDTSEQIKGKGQELKGKVQQGIGRVKERMDPEPGVDEE